MQRLDDQPSEQYVKALVYGPSGTGKTNLGVSAPRPLILLSERQAVLHVRDAALRQQVKVPPTILMDRVEDYRVVHRALLGDRSKPFRIPGVLELEEWPQTVVLDSYTDAGHMIVREIRQTAPPTPDSQGLPRDAERFWMVLGDRALNLVLAFKALPMHVLFLCRMDDRMVGKGRKAKRVVGPDTPTRNLAQELAGAVNVVGASYRTGQGGHADYGVMFTGPDGFTLKAVAPLRARERPDFTAWVEAINGNLQAVGQPLPAAPEEQEEGEEHPLDEPMAPEQPPAATEGPEAKPGEEPAEAAEEPTMCSACGKVQVEQEGLVCQECEAAIPPAEEPKKGKGRRRKTGSV